MSGNDGDPKPASPSILDEKIDELEVLLENRGGSTATGRMDGNIPVLDDVVEFDDSPDTDEPYYPSPELDADDIEKRVHHAIDNIDEKITDELEALVNILKDNIRDSVLTEIRQQLETEHNELSGHANHLPTSDKQD